MPMLKQCAYAGCFKLIPDGQRYCSKHAPMAAAIQEKRRQESESKRLTANERGYTSAWRRAAKAFLKLHPLCAECERNGSLKYAEVVDHIKPHKGDKSLFWDSNNWQPLCKECHDRKTATEDGGFGRKKENP